VGSGSFSFLPVDLIEELRDIVPVQSRLLCCYVLLLLLLIFKESKIKFLLASMKSLTPEKIDQ